MTDTNNWTESLLGPAPTAADYAAETARICAADVERSAAKAEQLLAGMNQTEVMAAAAAHRAVTAAVAAGDPNAETNAARTAVGAAMNDSTRLYWVAVGATNAAEHTAEQAERFAREAERAGKRMPAAAAETAREARKAARRADRARVTVRAILARVSEHNSVVTAAHLIATTTLANRARAAEVEDIMRLLEPGA